jgi:diguanylate cyclase (GGDEF)-like protein
MPTAPHIEEELTEIDALRNRLESLVHDARRNEVTLRKFQNLELRLLSCSSLAELMQLVTHKSKSTFGWDVLTIILHDEHQDIKRLLRDVGEDTSRYPELIFTNDTLKLKKFYGRYKKPLLGTFDGHIHEDLFLADRKFPRSVALLPLFRKNKLLGSLNLGSFQAGRFNKHDATDFLEHLAAVLATCLDTTIAQENLKQAGLTDALTGVNNRRFFDQRLSEEISRAQRLKSSVSCLFIDIDHFKVVNDSFGHETGDMVLTKVAELIRVQLRNIDVVARYGGEEFAVLLEQSGQDYAEEVAERIQQSIAETVFVEGEDCTLNVSIGVSTIEQPTTKQNTFDLGRELLRKADKAVYQAKQDGRNKVVLHSTL